MTGKRNGGEQNPARGAGPLSLDALIGRKIQLRRGALNIAVDELAQTVGVTREQLEAFEAGRVRVDPQRLAALAQALGVSTAWFFIRIDD